jgi:hypothetical protein
MHARILPQLISFGIMPIKCLKCCLELRRNTERVQFAAFSTAFLGSFYQYIPKGYETSAYVQ